MINIVFTDDDIKRSNLFFEILKKKSYYPMINIHFCESADEARTKLRNEIDILVLDVVIPKKLRGTPSASVSINLLKDIFSTNSRYIKPKSIIGLTADEEFISEHRNIFYDYATLILNGHRSNVKWIDSLLLQIEGFINSEKVILSNERNRTLITVHGIRTYAVWQRKISETVDEYSNSYNHIHFKYGFLDVFSFSIPWLRNRIQTKIARRILRKIEECATDDISIIAHSFGTLIAHQAIEELKNKKLNNIIFCGSPLNATENIDFICEKSNIFINDCGTRDFILILSRLLLVGLGDAGRRGFQCEQDGKFLNRYYKGGHSLYFNKKDNYAFIHKNWIPILALDAKPTLSDDRKNYLMEDLFEFLLALFDKLKPIAYLALIFFFSYMAIS